MTEFRVMLEGGSVLVVSMSVEQPEEVVAPEPEALGTALLKALGLSRPTTRPTGPNGELMPPPSKPRRPAPPPEENPDTWLRRTSEQSLGQRFKRNTRADGDLGD